jgi:hypothetical protein
MRSNEETRECSREAQRLRGFLAQKDLDRSFDLQVLAYASGLECWDAELRKKLNGVLEELKSCAYIGGYDYTGTTYRIRK